MINVNFSYRSGGSRPRLEFGGFILDPSNRICPGLEPIALHEKLLEVIALVKGVSRGR